MSAARYAPPSAPLRFYAYVVIDRSKSPAVPLTVKLSRKSCQDFIREQANSSELRVRRAKVTLFDS